MLKKLLTLSFMLLFASSLLVAQSTHVLKANGDLIKLNGKNTNEAIIGSKIKSGNGEFIKNIMLDAKFENPQGTLDTLAYSDMAPFNTNFGMFDQNVMFQYFVAPADMTIKGAGFSTSDDAGSANATVSVRLLKLNWTYEQLTSVPAPLNMGVYPEDGDGLGGTDPFGENATGNWTDFSGGLYELPPWADNVDPAANTFDYDLWSDGGFGWPVTAVASPLDAKVYQWVNMEDLGFEPELLQGEVFAVAITHDGTDPAFADRVGFWSDNSIGIPGWKYYEEGRLAAGDGWFARQYTWDFVVAVDLTGDRGPVVSGVTRLLTTVETGPLTVDVNITDDNPSGGAAGVATAELHYSLDTGATFTPVAMTLTSGDNLAGDWTADIPGQSPGTLITYKVVATDVGGFTTESGAISYGIFANVNKELLVVFNGGSEGRANQLAGFYLQGLVPAFDLWAAYGPIGDFISFYDAVLVIHAEGGPSDNNQEALRNYAALGGKVLGVIGQEVLGHLNGYTDSVFVAGDYEYDVLGVMESFNDVGAQTGRSALIPIAGTMLGDDLAQWVTDNNVDTLWFDPNGILGSDNWMDQFTPRADIGSEVFIHALTNADGTERPAGHNFTDANGTQVMFTSVDPLVFNSDSGWVGNSTLTPLAKFLEAYVVSVRKVDEGVPSEFVLAQNYPNPFNPSTVINYSLTKSADVSLVIYDVLGREVATVLNATQTAGSYQATWNGLNNNGAKVNSGVYFYTITAGDFVQTKKMMLLK